MPAHFYIDLANQDPSTLVNTQLQLDAERSNYVCRVMRLKAGQFLRCFDGNGSQFDAEILSASSKACRLRINKIIQYVPPPPNKLSVGFSLLKGQAQDRALAQSVELGVTHIYLFASQFSNVKLNPERLEKKISHWHRVIIAAAEQCNQSHLPALTITTLVDLFDQHQSVIALVPNQPTLPTNLPKGDRLVLIGPEGGWSNEELALFTQQNCEEYGLGPRILRAETVPAVALALVQQAQGWV